VAKTKISTKQFREQFKPGDALPKDLVVCRAEPFQVHKEEGDLEKLIKTFTISTPTVDREGDRLLPNWELNNFQKGGSVLWGHDSRTTPHHVIAAPMATWQEGDALKSRAKFTPAEINPTGFMVHQLIEFGALRSSSVGFLPKEWKIIDDTARYGYDFEKLELLEWSVVPVPANPEALVDAKAHGIDVDPFVSWAEEVLDKGSDLVVVEKDLLEAAWKVIKAPAVQVPANPPAAQEPEPPVAQEAAGEKSKPDVTMTIDASQVEETFNKIAELVLKLDKRVDELTKKLEALQPSENPKTETRAQRPDEVEIDLADPEMLKVIREEISGLVDSTLRQLKGQLPD